VPELISYGLEAPKGMPPDTNIELEGGSTLILDEYGELKFEVSNRLPSPPAADDDPWHRSRFMARWQRRIDYLWRSDLTSGANRSSLLASLHRQRTEDNSVSPRLQFQLQRRHSAQVWR
jgi:hypothetical protein